jgi:hypothetical protein
VDDITCSAVRDLSHEEINWVITKLRAMAASLGFRLKREKETLANSGSRMVATKLVVNVKAALPSEQRSKIRAAVNAYEPSAAANKAGVLDKSFNRISGQLAHMTQYHPAEGRALRAKLLTARRCVISLPSSEKSA